MYQNPRSLFQKKIREILKKEKPETSNILEHIFSLQQLLQLSNKSTDTDKQNWKNILELYSIVGLSKFIEIIASLQNTILQVPSENYLKEAILVVLSYYYREVEKKSWKEIRSLTGLQKAETIKYGIYIRQLDTFIKKGTMSTKNNKEECNE